MQQEGHVSSGKAGRPGGARALRRTLFAAVVALALVPARAESPDFRHRPLLAGRASLADDGFVVRRELGVANFSPELRLPVELVYESSSERTGLFGFAWRCPQLESSVRWERDALLWTTPWGERIRFHSKKEKVPENAVKIPVVEEAKRGRGFYAPYSDWEADTPDRDPARSGSWTFKGRRTYLGWTFAYRNARLVRIAAPSGRTIEFAYERGVLKSVSQGGCAFIEVSNEGGLARTLAVNGVQTRLAYADGTLEILPRTVEGRVETASRPRLVSCRTADLDPFEYAYDGNYLSEVRCGAFSEKFTVQRETLAERRRNIRAAQPKGGVEHTGKVAGRLLSDGDYSYAYGRLRPNGGGTRVTLENRLGETAVFDLDRNTGVFDLTEFSGRKYTIHYFMRYDVAYLGWIQRVVDGRGRDVVSYRYDAKTGRPVRIRDRLGNDRLFEYDGAGRLVRESRRARGVSAIEPVKSLAYDLRDNPVAVSLLDADGRAAMTVTAEYDGENRPVHVSDGRRAVSIAYSKGGYPVSLTGDDGPIAEIRYGDFNRPVSRRNADGIETRLSYNAAGLVSRVERRDADGVISFLEVSYDGAGRPVSLRDHRGAVRRFERDALGNVAREFFPDGAGVGYARDALGRLVSVLDENGHEIKFAWDRFGLASRTTAVGQLTSYVRDGSGLLTESSSSRDGRTDRRIRREYDGYDRVIRKVYAKDEVETFAYDAWGRLARHTRGKRAETYAYDHFGRLVERCEDGVRTTFAYDAWGCRTRRRTVDARGRLLSDETRRYDARGRLSGIESDGAPIAYAYDRRGRVASQTVAGRRMVFAYTRHGRLASKTLMGPDGPVSELKYWYARDGRLEARLANGELRRYFHDARGRLVAVQDRDGEVLEKYEYDPAGNILAKTVGGRRTEYEYDAANQLVSSGDDFARTEYAYDAAGRLVREGTKTYRYGWLDKVLAVSDGDGTRTFGWHVDGQLASVTYGGRTEDFTWDGLALVRRGGESFVNEPHLGGGAAVWSSGGGVLFNDLLATTLGAQGEDGAYTPFARTSFGEDVPRPSGSSGQSRSFFTGKPHVEGLGHAFLLRAYRPDLGKWLVTDPLGYPDGWNQLAYCNNRLMEAIDWLGGHTIGTQSYILDVGSNYGETYLYYAIRLLCKCNHKYNGPVLSPFLVGGGFWDADSPSLIFDVYDEELDLVYQTYVDVDYQLATSKQITHDTLTGREVEIWANVFMEMTETNGLTGEITSLAYREYKDLHFYCFISE